MATVTTIPITVEPEAQARIAELRMQREFERMLEHAKQKIADLRTIRVTLEYDYEEEREPSIVINTHRPDPGPEEYDPTDAEWISWVVREFPSSVFQHFIMMSFYEPVNAG